MAKNYYYKKACSSDVSDLHNSTAGFAHHIRGVGGTPDIFRPGSVLVGLDRVPKQNIQNAEVPQHVVWHADSSQAFACRPQGVPYAYRQFFA